MLIAGLLTLLVGFVVALVVLIPATWFALWVSETVTGMESHGYIGWHVQLTMLVYAAFMLYGDAFRYLFDKIDFLLYLATVSAKAGEAE